MIVLTLALYYVLALALVGGTVLLALYQNKRSADAAYARVQESLRKWAASTPPLPPYAPAPIDDEFEDASSAEDTPDLSDAALQPIAPLLLRVAREYLDKPAARERLVRSLTEALEAPTPTAS